MSIGHRSNARPTSRSRAWRERERLDLLRMDDLFDDEDDRVVTYADVIASAEAAALLVFDLPC